MSKIKNVMVRIQSNIEIRAEAAKSVSHRKNENLIVLLDTAMNSDNIGDQIIMYFADRLLQPLLAQYDVVRVASHTYPTEEEIQLMFEAKYVIICGTNILSPQMELYSGWKFNKKQIHLDNVILMGAGWWGYKNPSIYSKFVYKNILTKRCLQSARDAQAEDALKKAGIDNVINTNCLTLWDIEEECTGVPSEKCDTVLFTVTGVYKDIEHDKIMISILKENYKRIIFWPQGVGDYQYYRDFLYDEKIEILDESLDAVTGFLRNTKTDYVGSRLHGGIYSLHFNKRIIVIAVDNRAVEIGNDTNLPVIRMEEIGDKLQDKIRSTWSTKLVLNKGNAKKWLDSLSNALK